MESIKNKVAIVGMGCVKFGENFDQSIDDMLIDAAYEAYADAGIEPEDIQAAWFGNLWSGHTGQILATPLKLSYIPVTHVENACATGSEALRGACYAVAAGACDIALAIGVEKLKDTGYMGLPQTRPNATWSYRLSSMTAPAGFALMATRYFAKNGLSLEEGKKLLAQIAVKNHYNGSLSPKAQFQKEITLEQALKAPMVSYPLGLFDCCPVSDGAAAAIVVRADMAKSFRPDPIYVKALQISPGAARGLHEPGLRLRARRGDSPRRRRRICRGRHQGPGQRDQLRRGARLFHHHRVDDHGGSAVQQRRQGC